MNNVGSQDQPNGSEKPDLNRIGAMATLGMLIGDGMRSRGDYLSIREAVFGCRARNLTPHGNLLSRRCIEAIVIASDSALTRFKLAYRSLLV